MSATLACLGVRIREIVFLFCFVFLMSTTSEDLGVRKRETAKRNRLRHQRAWVSEEKKQYRNCLDAISACLGVRRKETVQKLSRCDISLLGCQMKRNTRSGTDGGRERLERQNKRRGRAESYMNGSDKKTKTERRYSKRERVERRAV